MSTFNRYGTKLIFQSEEVPKTINGKNFKISFQEYDKTKLFNREVIKYEVIIESKSISRSQFACDLIMCSMCLLEGSIVLHVRDIAVYPLNPESEEEPLYDSNLSGVQTQGIYLACRLAAKISFRNSYVNSINKYFISCETQSTHWIDLDPSHSDNIPLSPFPYDHIRFGYSIVIAYSIVEELKLDVRASANKPSLINGKWNQVVKEDLENRLVNSKIDITKPIIWERRGAIKALEKRKTPSTVKKASWAYGNVRDCEVLLIDAINNTSWLRSNIAAHKIHRDIKVLSVYDVSNAQHLARRLILESLGFWEIKDR